MVKLNERKLTTQKGLEELREFLKGFNFDADIKKTSSSLKFFARIDIGDEKYVYRNCDCYFIIVNGELLIHAVDEYDYCWDLSYDRYIKRISFIDCIASFTNVLEKYNQEVVNKEKEIEEFLSLMSEWKNR